MLQPNKNFIFSRSNYSCTIFVLPSYSLHIQVMLIVISINVQYLQNVVFSFEKGSSGQSHSLSGSHHPVEKSPPGKFPIPYPLTLFWKPWAEDQACWSLFAFYDKVDDKFNYFFVIKICVFGFHLLEAILKENARIDIFIPS